MLVGLGNSESSKLVPLMVNYLDHEGRHCRSLLCYDDYPTVPLDPTPNEHRTQLL